MGQGLGDLVEEAGVKTFWGASEDGTRQEEGNFRID